MRGTAEIREAKRKISERAARRQLTRLSGQQASEVDRFDIAVYFGDPAQNMYQLRQWVEPLKSLSEEFAVEVVFRCADSAVQALKDPDFCLPVEYAGRHSELDPLVERRGIRAVFYVNHHKSNFAMLSHPGVTHVYLGHGESDKLAVSASNQLKSYDFAFVAGQAAIDRIRRRLINFDANQRLVPIGRPQVDFPTRRSNLAGPTSKQFTLLYAPSWEGDRASNAYGSVESHGRHVIDEALADGRVRIIFRPHPLSGDVRTDYGKAVKALTERIAAAASQDRGAGHFTDLGAEFGWQAEVADFCVTDVSAVAFDWLATSKPLVICDPASPQALVDSTSMSANLPRWAPNSGPDLVGLLDSQLTDEGAAELDDLRKYCFGEGSAMTRFRNATEDVLRTRDAGLKALGRL